MHGYRYEVNISQKGRVLFFGIFTSALFSSGGNVLFLSQRSVEETRIDSDLNVVDDFLICGVAYKLK